MKYKYLEHTADIKFQAFGKNVEEVFSNSALAMFNAMSEEKVNALGNGTREEIRKKVKAEGKDYESLLYNFLEELLVLFDGEIFFLSEVKSLKIKDMKLEAEVVGDSAENYKITIDVKAITYNDMFVREEKKGKWVAQVVLDV